MHLIERNIEDAFTIIKQAILKRQDEFKKNINTNVNQQQVKSRNLSDSIHLSTKLWSLYVDMENLFGTLDTTKAAYQKMIDLKVITPQILLNYAQYLQSRKLIILIQS